jgi:hypothetical protein
VRWLDELIVALWHDLQAHMEWKVVDQTLRETRGEALSRRGRAAQQAIMVTLLALGLGWTAAPMHGRTNSLRQTRRAVPVLLYLPFLSYGAANRPVHGHTSSLHQIWRASTCSCDVASG